MSTIQLSQTRSPIFLRAVMAEDLMTPDPVSVPDTASVRETVAFLIDRGISGAPVIDQAGRPVGVLSQTDILIHDREEVEHLSPPEHETGAPLPARYWGEFQFERVDGARVCDVMTPAVFAVGLHSPAAKVIEQMRELNVHRLFVVDATGVLVGVITALDVLRHLDVSGG